jgi:hypothetical protein
MGRGLTARGTVIRNDFRRIPDQPNKLFLDMKAIEKMFKIARSALRA